jgi:hypothetical protein
MTGLGQVSYRISGDLGDKAVVRVFGYPKEVSPPSGVPSRQPSGRCRGPEISGLAVPGHTRWFSSQVPERGFPRDLRPSRY